jgi:hypothetical protein
MPKHGELTIQFRIHNDVGADVVLSRSQALELHSALTTVLQETNDVPPVKKPAPKK